MATNTPNWNLSKPEATDRQSDFISDYCGNMDIIDQHLGSGGGGGGGIYGVFVDPSKIVVPMTAFYDTLSYTATEDCFVSLYIITGRGDVFCKIDGQDVWLLNDGQVAGQGNLIPLKKGQILTVTNAGTLYANYYIVYGVIGGSNPIFAPIIYSDTEREVGTWRDNKPLYQRSYAVNLTLPYNTWVNTGINIPDGCIVKTEGVVYGVDGITIGIIGNIDSVGDLYVLNLRNINAPIDTITVWYTKTTDTAGSGNWNVDGVPMHHYSTSEQVVGTWINNKPLYEITIEADNPTAYVVGSKKYVEVPYNINTIDFAKCVNCSIYDTSDGRWYSLPYQRISSAENIEVMEMTKSDGSYTVTAHWASSNAYNITKVRYTIQYTKTTD